MARLAWVKQTGDDRWLAVCPAHNDGRPSLSVRELPDGRTLVHCFGGCAANDVVAAVGLELSDLFPKKPITDRFIKGERVPFVSADMLRAMAPEIIELVLLGGSLSRSEALAPAERQRSLIAAKRLLDAIDAAVPPKDRRNTYRHAMRVSDEDLAEVAG